MSRFDGEDPNGAGVRVPFVALTAAVSVGVATFFTLYSLIPVTRTDTPGLGSAFVGVLMTCVIAVQVGTPALVRRFTLRGVVTGSLVLLLTGTLVAGIAGTGTVHGAGLIALLAGGAVAGAGFGILIVAGSQGVGLLVTGPGLGRALGVYGLVTVLATALGSPAGVQLGVSASPAVLGVTAAVLCGLGAVAALGIPSSVGRAPTPSTTAPPSADASLDPAAEAPTPPTDTAPQDTPPTGPTPHDPTTAPPDEPPHSSSRDGQATSTAGALRLLSLTLVFLLLAVLFLSHGITSLPVLATDSVGPAATILLVQLGTAGGRWLGGFAEPRLTRSGTILLATVLILAGGITGVLGSAISLVAVSAVVLGVGIGTAQTVALHTAMRRTDPGRASVVWNLSVDAGLWLGGVLAGLVLAAGATTTGVLVTAAALAVTGTVLAVRERVRF
ncbi:MFS transporter [Brevibacterium yomogidense]|uniref:MFS transporter n=1 Tax=Brevibacterium yomogidense TaxID=946573 RepID=UPI0018DF2DBA|nr:MFS transporter [Brevibacterium yomogidense]